MFVRAYSTQRHGLAPSTNFYRTIFSTAIKWGARAMALLCFTAMQVYAALPWEPVERVPPATYVCSYDPPAYGASPYDACLVLYSGACSGPNADPTWCYHYYWDLPTLTCPGLFVAACSIDWVKKTEPGAGLRWTNYPFVAPICPTATPAFSYKRETNTCERATPSIKLGSCGDSAQVANPIHAGTGNKYQKETDYTGLGAFPLQLNRSYNSAGNPGPGMFGPLWRSTYDRAVHFDNANPDIVAASVYRPDGQMYVFTYQYGYYSWTDLDVVHRLVNTYDTSGVQTGYKYTSEAAETELYDLNGKLLSITNRVGLVQTLTYSDATTPTVIAPRPGLLIQVTDPFGRQLNFTYDASGKVATMTDPAGQQFLYAYDSGGRLNVVTYPDATPAITTDNPKRIYYYENTNFPNALTGISDENGVRFATWGYDGAGRAISSEHAGGADKTVLGYNADGSTTVTDYKDSTATPNASRTYTFQNILGAPKTTSVSQPCASCGGASAAARTYDANGNVASKIDFNGNLTCSYYSSDNLEYIRAEGLTGTTCPTDLSTWTPAPNTAQRKISKFWNSTYRIPTDVYEPKRWTHYSISGCGASGVVCAKTIYETTDANGGAGYFPTYTSPFNTRIWAYTYNAQGQVLTVDGPRTDVSDVTTYSYYTTTTANYRAGALNTITNALGHVTTINSYDGNGRPLSITDPNGLVTTLTYTPRGWLNTRTVGGLLTQFTYDNVDQLTKVTQPDGSFISYVYDPAHRLTDITNAAGDTIHYTLDLMGNRTQEQVKDGLGVVKQQKGRVFDALSRLATELNAANQIIASYTYDNNGNLKTQTQKYDATTTNDAVTSFDYDPLNRLTKITNALAGITQYNYDGVDHLVSVTDPKTLITNYGVDGLDNQKQLVSPDTGTTNSTYDAAGNLKTSTDARGKISTYSYDSLNRITGVTYSDTTPALGYLYDDITLGNFGKGRLTKITDGTGNTTFKFDIQGRLIQKTQSTGTVVKTVSYGYDTVGRMNTMTYPSGKVLTYTFDVQGRIASMAVNGTNLVSGITYFPFAVAKSWTWNGGPVQTRNFDLNGRQTSYPYTATGAVNLAYDLGNRITALTGTVAKTYAYDKLDRLTVESTNQTYQYDANGNRTQFKNGNKISTYNNPTTSNKLISITGTGPEAYGYDLAGNTTTIAATTLAYDARSRFTIHTNGTAVTSFGYSAIDQRLIKTGTTTTRFVYGEDGKLLGEYDNAGALITEHVYLNDMPIAAIKTAGAYMVQADHLNTPRAVLGASNVLAWKWDSDSFGTTAANEKPSTLATFNYNLRFPGQYYDKETLTHYNYFRDYNPKTGRYIESDPIGLLGGINTYAYVGNNPVNLVDPDGLEPGKGERDYARNPGGTKNPGKGWKDDPKNPGWGWQKDPQTGKDKYKKRPPYVPPPPPPETKKNEMCGDGCKATLVGAACVACALAPEICLPVAAIGAATQ